MNDATARVVGGIYFAIRSALSTEGARLADHILFGLADNPSIRPEDQRIYRAIADSASKSPEELEERPSRPFLYLVGGTAT